MTDAIAQFVSACREAGLDLLAPIADGVIHRCPLLGDKKRGKDGAYLLYLDGCPAGYIQNFYSGECITWRYNGEIDAKNRVTQADIQARQRARDQHRQAEAEQAARRAWWIWQAATNATTDHPYVLRKKIVPHNARRYEGALVIAATDAAGNIRSLQYIWDNGTKRFLSAAPMAGLRCVIGDIGTSGPLILCEGWATACTLHDLTGCTTIAAYDAGNIGKVAQSIRAQDPQREIIIAGDDDWQKALQIDHNGKHKPNTGRIKSTAAAQDIGARVIFPPVDPDITDFNDCAVFYGCDAARRVVMDLMRGPDAPIKRPLDRVSKKRLYALGFAILREPGITPQGFINRMRAANALFRDAALDNDTLEDICVWIVKRHAMEAHSA